MVTFGVNEFLFPLVFNVLAMLLFSLFVGHVGSLLGGKRQVGENVEVLEAE
jgi:hypothetical protein